MPSGATSADPADLERYVDASTAGSSRLRVAAGELAGALAGFRASAGRSTFVPVVPDVDLSVTFLARRSDRLGDWVAQVATAFRRAGGDGVSTITAEDLVEAGVRPWSPPAFETVERNGRIVVDTGRGDDEVLVLTTDDGVVLIVDGRLYTLATDADAVVIRGGGGDDDIALAVAPGRSFTLDGGAGDDALTGSAGSDVLIGGAGFDLVYGLDGDDLIDGGTGRDHLDGGTGDDVVDGGGADDIVSGGEGDDRLFGGDGDDVLYAGPGFDEVAGGEGADALNVEGFDEATAGPGDTVLEATVDLSLIDDIVIEPDGTAFAAQVRSDLVTLASTAEGRIVLESLRGRRITVVPPGADNPTFQWDGATDEVTYAPGVAPADHGFGPAGADRPEGTLSVSPLVALHHELVHASHRLNDTVVEGDYDGDDRNQLDRDRDGDIDDDDAAVPNSERAATGLPVDPDSDLSTPDVWADEVVPGIVGTDENALRHELGLPERGRY